MNSSADSEDEFFETEESLHASPRKSNSTHTSPNLEERQESAVELSAEGAIAENVFQEKGTYKVPECEISQSYRIKNLDSGEEILIDEGADQEVFAESLDSLSRGSGTWSASAGVLRNIGHTSSPYPITEEVSRRERNGDDPPGVEPPQDKVQSVQAASFPDDVAEQHVPDDVAEQQFDDVAEQHFPDEVIPARPAASPYAEAQRPVTQSVVRPEEDSEIVLTPVEVTDREPADEYQP
ncbi:hypothetical protein CYMTET_34534, partial [Cymbomonas tetramitiformis]